jgi:Zn-dependent protease
MMALSSWNGFGIGWGKPVQVNPYNFRHPRWDNLRVSLWGPLSNLITAAVVGTILRFTVAQLPKNAFELLFMIVLISISLALFNLIPISPLDGSHILSSLLPLELARSYDMFMSRYGFLVLMGLIFLVPGAISSIIGRPAHLLLDQFVGVKVITRYFIGI